MGLFLVIATAFTFFGPVTLEKADKLDGKHDGNFTAENYHAALEPIELVDYSKLND